MSNENIISEYKRKVWITRKCRIEASERILKKYKFYKILLVYYSIIIVAYSIWNIQPKNLDGHITDSSLFLLIASIVFSLFSLYVSTTNLHEKYFNFKTIYIEIDKIYGKLNEIDPSKSDEFSHIQEQYNNLLLSVDNHEMIDYYKVILNSSEEMKSLKQEEIANINKYIRKYEHKETIIKYLFYSMPIILPILIRGFIYLINFLYPTI